MIEPSKKDNSCDSDEDPRKLLSVVAPVYNEQAVVHIFHSRLVDVLKTTEFPYEVVYVNDGSQDATLKILQEILL